MIDRLDEISRSAAGSGIDALVIGAGPDLRWICGYGGRQLERLTCLVVRAGRPAVVVIPALDRPAFQASVRPGVPAAVRAWEEHEDPVAIVSDLVGGGPLTVGVDDHFPAGQLLPLQSALPEARWTSARDVLAGPRVRKTPGEIGELRVAAAAIDEVHRGMGDVLRAGRTELAVAADVAAAMVAVGHARADYVIIASGPNSASPHHQPSGRVIREGDVVVVDIAGPMPSGYWSDSTRTYVIGDRAPDGFTDRYAVLEDAQRAQREAVAAGRLSREIDAVGRDRLAAHGLGPAFLHRTGHGIGLEVHEAPYIAEHTDVALEVGMVFTIEPGFYLEDRYGARIEDVVAITEEGPESLNSTDRSLRFL